MHPEDILVGQPELIGQVLFFYFAAVVLQRLRPERDFVLELKKALDARQSAVKKVQN